MVLQSADLLTPKKSSPAGSSDPPQRQEGGQVAAGAGGGIWGWQVCLVEGRGRVSPSRSWAASRHRVPPIRVPHHERGDHVGWPD
eukprot:scaffold54911_cov18-Tisochrysis_lutea.AAC.1